MRVYAAPIRVGEPIAHVYYPSAVKKCHNRFCCTPEIKWLAFGVEYCAVVIIAAVSARGWTAVTLLAQFDTSTCDQKCNQK